MSELENTPRVWTERETAQWGVISVPENTQQGPGLDQLPPLFTPCEGRQGAEQAAADYDGSKVVYQETYKTTVQRIIE